VILPRPSRSTAAMQPSLIRTVHDRKRPSSLNLGLGQPSLPTPPELLDEGIRRLRAGPMGYTANAGMPELRERIAAYHHLEGRAEADAVVVTCGAQEAILAVMWACLDPGDEVIVPDPAFPSYAAIATLLGARAVPVARDPAQGFRLDPDAVAAAISERTKLVVVNSPGNPTGTVDDPAAVAALAELAEARGLAILSDEVYAELYFGEAPPPSPARLTRNTFLVGGLSKSCAMTGFRLGFVIGPPERMVNVLRAHHMAATCAPVLSQHMAQVAFERPQLLGAHRPVYTERRTAALRSLQAHLDLPLVEPDGAFYILLDATRLGVDSLELALELLDRTDVITAPGAAFGAVTGRWLRLTFADEPAVFDEAVGRIGAHLRGRSS